MSEETNPNICPTCHNLIRITVSLDGEQIQSMYRPGSTNFGEHLDEAWEIGRKYAEDIQSGATEVITSKNFTGP